MSNLINSAPRFALEEANNTIFDYATSRSIPIGGIYKSIDGNWDTVQLARLIRTGQSIEGARSKAAASSPDKVDQANKDFLDHGLSPEELQKRDLETQQKIAAAAAHQTQSQAMAAGTASQQKPIV